MPPAPPPNLPEAPLDRDVPCQPCGYNLRGLLRSGLCPECGWLIDFSLQGDLLRFEDPAWLAKLVLAAKWAGWTLAGMLISFMALPAIYYLEPWLSPDFQVATIWAFMSEIMIACASLLVGVTIFTAQNPQTATSESLLSARRIARGCALISVFTLAPSVFLPRIPSLGAWDPFVRFATSPAGLPGIVGATAYRMYLCQIVQRIPDSKMLDYLKAVYGTYAFSWSIFAVAGGISRFRAPTLLQACVGGPAFLTMAISGILLLSCAAGIAHALRVERRHAEQISHANRMIAPHRQ